MGQIFKRRRRRPVTIHRGTRRTAPNFYPNFYDGLGATSHLNIGSRKPSYGIHFSPRTIGDFGGDYNVFLDYIRNNSDFDITKEGAADAVLGLWNHGKDYNTTVEDVFSGLAGYMRDADEATGGGGVEENGKGGGDGNVLGKVAAGLSGLGKLAGDFSDLNSVADTSLLDARRDELENMDYSGIGSASDALSAWNSTGFIRNPVTYRQMRGKSDGELALGVGKSIADGALTGLEVGGPWGALAGAVVGTGTGLWGLLSGNGRARRKKKEENDAIRLADANATNTYAGAAQTAFKRAFNRGLGTLTAYGGRIYAGGGGEESDSPKGFRGWLSSNVGSLRRFFSPKPDEPEWEEVPAVYDPTTQRLRPMNEDEAANYAEYGHPDGRWSENEGYEGMMGEFPRIFGFTPYGRQSELLRAVWESGMRHGLSVPQISAIMAMVMNEVPDDFSDERMKKYEKPIHSYQKDKDGNFVKDADGKKIRLDWDGLMERTSGPFQFSETYYVDPDDRSKVTKEAAADTSYKRYVNWLKANGLEGSVADAVEYYISTYMPDKFSQYRNRGNVEDFGPYGEGGVDVEAMWNDPSADAGRLADIANYIFQRSASMGDDEYRARNAVRARALADFYNALYTTHSKGDPYDLKVRVERGNARGGPIHIDPKNRGKFREEAERAGQGVQEHARSVMRNPNATPQQRRRANFAINAAKWHHGKGRRKAGGGLLREYK